MSDLPIPTATSPSDERLIGDVTAHGWHVIKVPAEGDTPGWAYSIGLFRTFGHPELIVFGLPLDVAHAVLNIAGDAIKKGKVFQHDVAYDDLVEDHDCTFKCVDPRWHNAFVGRGAWFYKRTGFPLMQIFWPDRDGVLPWQPVASAWQRANQPLLYEGTAEAARVGALLASLDTA